MVPRAAIISSRSPVQVGFALLVLIGTCPGGGDDDTPFAFRSGQYTMLVSFTSNFPSNSANRTGKAAVVVANGKITITIDDDERYPIKGRLVGKTYSANLNDAGGKVKFSGELIGNNTIRGTLSGKSNDGSETVNGIFILQPKMGGQP